MRQHFLNPTCVLLSAFIVLLTAFITSSTPSVVRAEPADSKDPIHVLDPVVVSATKTPVPLSQLTSAAEVFTEEDFQIRKIRTVLDMLRLSQGTAVFSSGGPGTAANVRIRGGNARQTLVLIDGA
ncbi:MAG: TonB-dependent receptor plug domain-containing protein, partial [Nitrospirales bacterium]